MFDKLMQFLNFEKSAAENGSSARRATPTPEIRTPTAEEWLLAKDNLQKDRRNASLAKLGGFRPDKENRHTSWWGGNFLGSREEKIPLCKDSGREMHPVLQIRLDELPYRPEVLNDIVLLTVWFDLQATGLIEAHNGHGFEIRTYNSLENLIPLGLGYREHETFPTFPITWHGLKGDLPDWEAFEGAPEMVMQSGQSDWFYDHPSRDQLRKMQQTMPVKIGGHDQWWQSPQCVDGGQYAFFIDTTMHGQLGFAGGGNGNFFRTPNGWELRVDFI